MDLLAALCSKNKRVYLLHPLFDAFIEMKWKKTWAENIKDDDCFMEVGFQHIKKFKDLKIHSNRKV